MPGWIDVSARGRSLQDRRRRTGRGPPNAGRHPKSARFTDLVNELRARSPEANAWWPRYDIATNAAGTKWVRRPDGQEIALTYASFQVAEHPEFVLTVYHRT